MSGGTSDSPHPPHKAYGITNIKSYVPLILDINSHNYDTWSDLFTAHCIAYDVLNHIDATYDPPKDPPTDPEWKKLDNMVKLWLFGSISQNLITTAYSPNATARKVWLNIFSLFNDNKETTAMQLESELRCITMGELTVHEYCNKIKRISDLLEGLGEKVKERHVVIHALNGLSGKYDGLAKPVRQPYHGRAVTGMEIKCINVNINTMAMWANTNRAYNNGLQYT